MGNGFQERLRIHTNRRIELLGFGERQSKRILAVFLEESPHIDDRICPQGLHGKIMGKPMLNLTLFSFADIPSVLVEGTLSVKFHMLYYII